MHAFSSDKALARARENRRLENGEYIRNACLITVVAILVNLNTVCDFVWRKCDQHLLSCSIDWLTHFSTQFCFGEKIYIESYYYYLPETCQSTLHKMSRSVCVCIRLIGFTHPRIQWTKFHSIPPLHTPSGTHRSIVCKYFATHFCFRLSHTGTYWRTCAIRYQWACVIHV